MEEKIKNEIFHKVTPEHTEKIKTFIETLLSANIEKGMVSFKTESKQIHIVIHAEKLNE